MAVSWIGLALIALAGWVALTCTARFLSSSKRSVGLSVLGIVAILGGLRMYAAHSPEPLAGVSSVRQVGDWDWDFDWDEALDPAHVEHMPWPNNAHGAWVGQSSSPPRWLAISLGTMLVIAGALLVGRERTRPVALRAFTVLGMVAIVAMIGSFLASPRHDPVVAHVGHAARRAAAPDTNAGSAGAKRVASQATRHSRAKRPSSRPDRPTDADRAIDTLPPRAGEIPLAFELAKSESTTAPAPVENPQPAAAGPPAATAEPATTSPAPETAARATTPNAEIAPPAVPTSVPAPVVKPPEPPAIVATPPSAAPAPAKSADAAAPGSASAPKDSSGPRPAWVNASPKLASGVYSMSVASGLFASVPECQRELNHQIKREADRYINEYLGEQAAPLVDVPLAFLRQHVVKAESAEVVVSESVGPMHQIHALLEFDDDARADFHRRWHDAVVNERLWYAGSGAALVLALLGTLYSYLKLDLRTGGSHKVKLQLAATLVALIAAAGALMARQAVPF